MEPEKDVRKSVHGEMRKTPGVYGLEKKREKALEERPTPAVCSSCGKENLYTLKLNTFKPSKCPSCNTTIINIYASEQTGVITAWTDI
jgi:predicted Zn-ribbon and HTH transcriptional regulator